MQDPWQTARTHLFQAVWVSTRTVTRRACHETVVERRDRWESALRAYRTINDAQRKRKMSNQNSGGSSNTSCSSRIPRILEVQFELCLPSHCAVFGLDNLYNTARAAVLIRSQFESTEAWLELKAPTCATNDALRVHKTHEHETKYVGNLS